MDDSQLLPYSEAIRRSGLSRRTWYDRLREAGVVVYQDGKDRRQRWIAAKDVEKLVALRPARRERSTAA